MQALETAKASIVAANTRPTQGCSPRERWKLCTLLNKIVLTMVDCVVGGRVTSLECKRCKIAESLIGAFVGRTAAANLVVELHAEYSGRDWKFEWHAKLRQNPERQADFVLVIPGTKSWARTSRFSTLESEQALGQLGQVTRVLHVLRWRRRWRHPGRIVEVEELRHIRLRRVPLGQRW